jgi:hypothetical protein
VTVVRRPIGRERLAKLQKMLKSPRLVALDVCVGKCADTVPAEEIIPSRDEPNPLHGEDAGEVALDPLMNSPKDLTLAPQPQIFHNLRELSLSKTTNYLTRIVACKYVFPALETLFLADVHEDVCGADLERLPTCFPRLRTFELRGLGEKGEPRRSPFLSGFLLDVLPTRFVNLEVVFLPDPCVDERQRRAMATNFVEHETYGSGRYSVRFSRR